MCREEQNILMCRREVDDVTADKGFVTAVTGSVHNVSTADEYGRDEERDESDPASLEGTRNT